MARTRAENPNAGNALGRAAIGGGLGLGAALALAAACAATFSGNANALQAERPAIVSAMNDCESGARDGAADGRALGACDILVRDPSFDDAMRARILVNRGVIALDRGSYGPARDDLEQAVRLAPDLAEAWLNLSAARVRTNDADGAIEAARTARERGANRALSLFNEAIALETLRRWDEAYETYLDAADAAPNNETLQAQPARFARHQG
ncbi:MAG: hypothetical protein ACOC0V_05000 [Oceanicaulis sp.]